MNPPLPAPQKALLPTVSTAKVARWTAGQALELSLPADAQIFRNDDTVAGVAVTYR